MSKSKPIVCAVDYSECAHRALGWALEQAKRVEAELHLVHVYQMPAYAMPDGAHLGGPDLLRALAEGAEEIMRQLIEKNAAAGVVLVPHVMEGAPHTQIVHVADEIGAQLIVMGTHGRSGLTRLLIGSVAARVLRISTVPVVAVAEAVPVE